jgi:capsular polysaccharide biosynthesis protein
MKTILKEAYLLKRKIPENYSLQDERHFLPDIEVTIKESHLKIFSKANIVQHYLFNGWTLETSYCLSRKINRKKKFNAFLKRLTFKKRKIQEAIWVLDQWSFGYFHWLTETLPRIIIAKESGYSFPVVFPENANRNLFFVDTIAALGIDSIFYNYKETIQLNTLVAPSHLQPAQCDPDQIKKVRDCFRNYDNAITSTGNKKRIYISRTIAQRRFIRNENELEKLLASFGFETIHMEKLSFSQQRKLMAETEVLISNHGAGLTNMIFLPENSTVIELKANADDINNCFFNLARALDHRYYYTINPSDNKMIQRANITVDLEKLQYFLTELFGKK